MTFYGRDIRHGRCSCGGVPLVVDSTEAEEKHDGCNTPGCCAMAIYCQACGTRFSFALEAPEADLDR